VVDLGVAYEAEAGRRVVVRHHVGVLLGSIVPEDQRLVDLARNRELDLAVALASRGRLEFRNALLEIGAAVEIEYIANIVSKLSLRFVFALPQQLPFSMVTRRATGAGIPFSCEAC